MAGIAITGLGAISPLGLTTEQMWDKLCRNESAVNTITAFDPQGFSCKLAGEVPPFKIQKFVPKSFRKSVKLMCKDIKLAIVAADEAVRSSGLITKGIDKENINVDPKRMAINLGAGLISCDIEELAPAVSASSTDGKFDMKKWGSEGLSMITPLWLLKYLPNMLACHVGIIHDIQGPSNTITCAESSGLIAMIEAAAVIKRGCCDIALAGAAEAKVNPIVMIRQCLLKRTAQDNGDPSKACRPFDKDASGCVFGEAAAVLVLENMQNAKKRGAKIYAEIAGTGQSSSLNTKYEHLEENGTGLKIAIENAIKDADIAPSDIDLIIPHGTAIPADDKAEAKAIADALGDAVHDICVWPTKSMITNCGAAAGAIDVTAAVLAIQNGIIPAAKNCDNKIDDCSLNIVTKETKKDIRYALCCSYTYGGQTAAVIIKKHE